MNIKKAWDRVAKRVQRALAPNEAAQAPKSNVARISRWIRSGLVSSKQTPYVRGRRAVAARLQAQVRWTKARGWFVNKETRRASERRQSAADLYVPQEPYRRPEHAVKMQDGKTLRPPTRREIIMRRKACKRGVVAA